MTSTATQCSLTAHGRASPSHLLDTSNWKTLEKSKPSSKTVSGTNIRAAENATSYSFSGGSGTGPVILWAMLLYASFMPQDLPSLMMVFRTHQTWVFSLQLKICIFHIVTQWPVGKCTLLNSIQVSELRESRELVWMNRHGQGHQVTQLMMKLKPSTYSTSWYIFSKDTYSICGGMH